MAIFLRRTAAEAVHSSQYDRQNEFQNLWKIFKTAALNDEYNISKSDLLNYPTRFEMINLRYASCELLFLYVLTLPDIQYLPSMQLPF